jgi:hypothetical protein
MPSIYWFARPLEAEALKASMFSSMDLYHALDFKKDLTVLWYKELEMRCKSRDNLIVSIFGSQGTGKSYVALYTLEKMAKFMNKPVNLDNVFFTLDDLSIGVERVGRNEVLVLDEQIETSGQGSSAERKGLVNIERVVRQHKLNFFFLAPEHIRHTYHYYLRVWQPGAFKPFNPNKTVEEQWELSRSVIYNVDNHPFGWIITAKPTNIKFLEAYEKKKSEFIDRVKARRGSGRYKFIGRRADDIIQDEKFKEEFRNAPRQPLKKLLLKEKLQGELITTDEFKELFDKVDLMIQREHGMKIIKKRRI